MNKQFLPIRELISGVIQKKRVQTGISIEELLEKLNLLEIKMTKRTYERIEDGSYYPTLEQFFMILKVLDCSIIIDGDKIN